MVYSGAWGKLIHEKNRSRKSRDTVPLNSILITARQIARLIGALWPDVMEWELVLYNKL